MKKASIIAVVFLGCILMVSVGYAQPPDPPGGGAPPCGGPFSAPCPIDGGVSLLVAAGLALGGKKAYDLGKKAK